MSGRVSALIVARDRARARILEFFADEIFRAAMFLLRQLTLFHVLANASELLSGPRTAPRAIGGCRPMGPR